MIKIIVTNAILNNGDNNALFTIESVLTSITFALETNQYTAINKPKSNYPFWNITRKRRITLNNIKHDTEINKERERITNQREIIQQQIRDGGICVLGTAHGETNLPKRHSLISLVIMIGFLNCICSIYCYVLVCCNWFRFLVLGIPSGETIPPGWWSLISTVIITWSAISKLFFFFIYSYLFVYLLLFLFLYFIRFDFFFFVSVLKYLSWLSFSLFVYVDNLKKEDIGDYIDVDNGVYNENLYW